MIKLRLAGVTFIEGFKTLPVQNGDAVKLIPDPDNQYDKNAIGVWWKEQRIGYIGARKDKDGLTDIDKVNNSEIYEATVNDASRNDEGELLGVGIQIGEPDVSELKDGELFSFNEPTEKFNFDKHAHKYTLVKDPTKKLISGSKIAEPYIVPFDKEGVAASCSGYWGISQEDILEQWNRGTEANLGTALHEVLEFYFNGLKHGLNPKTGKSYFMPKMPFVADFIESLEELLKKLPKEENSIQEPLVSNANKGYVGFIDRLSIIDAEKKICRVQDYKINHSVDKKGEVKFLEPYTHLETTKLSKIRFQLSFYAKLLEWSGWTIQGLDVLVWDGQWKHYEVEPLDINI